MDKIEKFIVWDTTDTIEAYYLSNHFRNVIQTDYKESSFLRYIMQSNRFSMASRFIFRYNNSRSNVLFLSDRYPTLIKKTSEVYNCFIVDKMKFSIRNKIQCISMVNILKNIANYYKSGDSQYLHISIELSKKILKKIDLSCIIFEQDSLPLERIIICACRELGIPTINVQDAIYQLSVPPLHGKAADYVFVWGELFKKYYMDYNVKSARQISVIGYPYNNPNHKNKSPNYNEQKVYYLGQNFERYNPRLLDYKIKTLNLLNEALKLSNTQLIYRPHPGDKPQLFENLSKNILISNKRESLGECLCKGNIFISFNSTSLVEASMLGKQTIQLLTYPSLQTDNFEQLGICNKTVSSINEIKNEIDLLLNLSDNKFIFNQNYIAYNINASKVFLDQINAILS